MSKTITSVSKITFLLFWALFIFAEYWSYHPEYDNAFRHFQYGSLALVLAGIILAVTGISWWLKRQGKKMPRVNGLGLLVGTYVLILLLMNAYFRVNTGSGLKSQENIQLLISITGTLLPTYLIVLLCFALGSLPGRGENLRLPAAGNRLIRVGIGIMIVVAILFVLGLVHLLKPLVLIPLFLILLGLAWRSARDFLLETLWRPFQLEGMNALGWSAFMLLWVLVTMNLIQVVRPFPIGFDALTLYVNLASLVRDYTGLVEGNQPYNWSLFMSLGFLLFNKTSVVLALSFLGGILSLLALYQLSRKWLDVNFSGLVLLLFYTMPLINWLSYRDMKVDMGLLFFSLCALLLFYRWASEPAGPGTSRGDTPAGERSFRGMLTAFSHRHQVLMLLGLFSGFALGIKLSALILMLGIIGAIWSVRGGNLFFLCSLGFILALVFIGRLDQEAGLRWAHPGIGPLQWGLLLMATALFAFLLIRQRSTTVAVVKTSLIFILFFGLTMLPWLGKNFSETGTLSVTGLTQGKTANPRFSVEDLDRVWRSQKNNTNE